MSYIPQLTQVSLPLPHPPGLIGFAPPGRPAAAATTVAAERVHQRHLAAGAACGGALSFGAAAGGAMFLRSLRTALFFGNKGMMFSLRGLRPRNPWCEMEGWDTLLCEIDWMAWCFLGVFCYHWGGLRMLFWLKGIHACDLLVFDLVVFVRLSCF